MPCTQPLTSRTFFMSDRSLKFRRSAFLQQPCSAKYDEASVGPSLQIPVPSPAGVINISVMQLQHGNILPDSSHRDTFKQVTSLRKTCKSDERRIRFVASLTLPK